MCNSLVGAFIHIISIKPPGNCHTHLTHEELEADDFSKVTMDSYSDILNPNPCFCFCFFFGVFTEPSFFTFRTTHKESNLQNIALLYLGINGTEWWTSLDHSSSCGKWELPPSCLETASLYSALFL